MSAWIERVRRPAERPPRKAAAYVARRLGRIGRVVHPVPSLGPTRPPSPFQSSPGATGSGSGGVRAGTDVSAVSPCAVITLGQPALPLLVPTPVSRHAVRQRDLAVSALGAFEDFVGANVVAVWTNLPSVQGMPQIWRETALRRVLRQFLH